MRRMRAFSQDFAWVATFRVGCQVPPATEYDALPSLQRLFVSYNAIGDLNAVACLERMPALLELALDGNPLAVEPSYRASVLDLARSIRHLDLRRVSDEERRLAASLAKREGEKQEAQARKEKEAEERSAAIRQIEEAWERRTAALLFSRAVLSIRCTVTCCCGQTSGSSALDEKERKSGSSGSSGGKME